MSDVRTQFNIDDVVRFVNKDDPDDPNNGSHVVITAINPAPIVFGNQAHYRIWVPSMLDETYALAEELFPPR